MCSGNTRKFYPSNCVQTQNIFVVCDHYNQNDMDISADLVYRLRHAGFSCVGKGDFMPGRIYVEEFCQFLKQTDCVVVLYTSSFAHSNCNCFDIPHIIQSQKSVVFIVFDESCLPCSFSTFSTILYNSVNWFEELVRIIKDRFNCSAFDKPLLENLNLVYSQFGRYETTIVCFRAYGINIKDNIVEIDLSNFDKFGCLNLSLLDCYNENISIPRDSISISIDNNRIIPLTSDNPSVKALNSLVSVILKGPSKDNLNKIGKEWYLACTKSANDMVPTETEMNCRSIVFTTVTEKLYDVQIRKEYHTLVKRVASFKKWPRDKVHSPLSMAHAGFYYEACDNARGTVDYVRCFACHMGMGNWRACQNPWARHARRSPNCPHVRENLSIEFINESRKNRPCSEEIYNAKYQDYSSRLNSFGIIYDGSELSKMEMSEAGFYFLGMGDAVACHKCGLCLDCRSFKADDNMWVIHATFSPKCDFVHSVKGGEFVKSVNSHPAMSQHNPSQRTLTFFVNSTSTFETQSHNYVHVL